MSATNRIYTKAEVESEKRDLGPALYDALYELMRVMVNDDPEIFDGESRGAHFRRLAVAADKRDEALARAWKVLGKVHQPDVGYYREELG